jgi:hypothetical protein
VTYAPELSPAFPRWLYGVRFATYVDLASYVVNELKQIGVEYTVLHVSAERHELLRRGGIEADRPAVTELDPVKRLALVQPGRSVVVTRVRMRPAGRAHLLPA